MSDLARIWISRSALRHNLRLLRQQGRGAPVCAVVKSNAYGHGLPLVAKTLAEMPVAFWGVTTPAEAAELRGAGLRQPILVLLPLDRYAPAAALREQVDALLEWNARLTIVNREGLALAAAGARRRRRPARIHLKADTGMGRQGCPAEELVDLALLARATPGVRLEGLYSHFAGADERNLESARRQLALFRSLVRTLAARGIRVPLCHMANSGAVFNLPAARLDMIRPGLALYGYGGPFLRGARRLRPALRLQAPLVGVRWIGKNRPCGYGATFVTRRRTRVGILPLGYADGYDRRWSNAGQVDFRGQLAPVIGRISMDLTLVDLTGLPGVRLGDWAGVISDRRSDPHCVQAMAQRLETIPHEITVALNTRIPRVLVP